MVGQTQKSPEWKVIVDMFRAVSWGDIITHETIASETQLPIASTPYYRQVSQACNVLLRDHDIAVENVVKIGYKRVEPNRYGERARRDARLGKRRLKHGLRVVKAVPVHLLTDEEMKKFEHATRLLAELSLQAHRVFRSMKDVLPAVTLRPTLAAAKPDRVQ